MQVKEIARIVENLAPTHLKEEWDNVGLQLGDPNASVQRILLALTPSLSVVEEAVAQGADMIVSHHPLLFKGTKTLCTDKTIGAISRLCFKHDIAIYCAHTNLDVAWGGVNDVLAECLGLTDVALLQETECKTRYKVVVFVPLDHLAAVQQAMFAAGAGAQGAYKECAWTVNGKGQFAPQEGATPYLGQVGRVEHVEEARLEVLVDLECLQNVLAAMKEAHPYEEVAYDVFRNEASVVRQGLGRIGRLSAPKRLDAWLEEVKERLGISRLAFAGDGTRMVERVALCGGSATEFLNVAKAKGADVYVTGDMKYHDAQQAVELNLPMVDVSHFAGERPVLAKLQHLLKAACGSAVDVRISQNERDFIQYQ